MEQIQFLLGHVSVQTTERYLGCTRRISSAVNDRIGIKPKTFGRVADDSLKTVFSRVARGYGFPPPIGPELVGRPSFLIAPVQEQLKATP